MLNKSLMKIFSDFSCKYGVLTEPKFWISQAPHSAVAKCVTWPTSNLIQEVALFQ